MSNDPEQIRREIERTRTELSDNVNALGDKVNPGSIAKRQVSRVRGAATSVKDAVMGSAADAADTGQRVAGYFVLLFLSIALWWAIGSATGLGWSALIVAVIWGIIGAVLYAAGRNSLKSVRGIPKTADTVKKIPDALKGNE